MLYLLFGCLLQLIISYITTLELIENYFTAETLFTVRSNYGEYYWGTEKRQQQNKNNLYCKWTLITLFLHILCITFLKTKVVKEEQKKPFQIVSCFIASSNEENIFVIKTIGVTPSIRSSECASLKMKKWLALGFWIRCSLQDYNVWLLSLTENYLRVSESPVKL